MFTTVHRRPRTGPLRRILLSPSQVALRSDENLYGSLPNFLQIDGSQSVGSEVLVVMMRLISRWTEAGRLRSLPLCERDRLTSEPEKCLIKMVLQRNLWVNSDGLGADVTVVGIGCPRTEVPSYLDSPSARVCLEGSSA